MILSIDDTHNRLHKSWIQHLNSRELNELFVQQLTALIAFSLCGTSWWEEKLKLVQRIPAALLSHSRWTYHLTLNSSILEEWHKPPGKCLVRRCGAGVLMRHHQSGRMFTFTTNKNQTWNSMQRSKVLQANRDRRVFIISALVACLSCKTSLSPSTPVYSGRKYPLKNRPFCECPLSHITPAVCPLTHRPWETNSFSFTGENNQPSRSSFISIKSTASTIALPKLIDSHRHTSLYFSPLHFGACCLDVAISDPSKRTPTGHWEEFSAIWCTHTPAKIALNGIIIVPCCAEKGEIAIFTSQQMTFIHTMHTWQVRLQVPS